MFDKRLLSLVPGIMPLIVGSVAAKWIALLCNIAIIATIGNVFAALLAGMPASGILALVRRLRARRRSALARR